MKQSDKKKNRKKEIDIKEMIALAKKGKTLASHLGLPQDATKAIKMAAQSALYKKQYQLAEKLANQLLVLDQKDSENWALLGNILKEAGLYRQAIQAWYAAFTINEDCRTALAMAQLAYALGELDIAEEFADTAIVFFDDDKNTQDSIVKLMVLIESKRKERGQKTNERR